MPAGPDTRRLTEMAVLLRSAAPDVWTQFVYEMIKYSDEITKTVIRAAPDHLFRAQGMAITANELADIFRTAHELHERNREFERSERTRKPNVANGN